jgi:hypothetical protein
MKPVAAAPLGRVPFAILYVIAWLLWSAIALRLPIDGVLLGLVWFGVPYASVWLFVRYWNTHMTVSDELYCMSVVDEGDDS